MGTRLYVGNLPFSTMEGDLQDLFSQAGKVLNCTVVTDKYTGKSRGFGFVEMASQEEADRAVSTFNGKDHSGRTLTVNEARPREDRPRRDDDGGGFGGGGRRSSRY